MRNKEIVERIFREVFMIAENEPIEDKNVLNLDTWNSFEHFSFISSIEDKFSITLSSSEIIEMNSYKAITSILEKYMEL